MSGVQLSEPLKSSSILDWIQDPRFTGLSVGAKSKAVRKCHVRTVQLFGSVFGTSEDSSSTSKTSPEEEEEDEGDYYYYFNNGRKGEATACLEGASQEWMATSLCVFAICKKYVEVRTCQPNDKLEEYLKVYPLVMQEKMLREWLKEGSSREAEMSADHLLAYKRVLEGIVKKGEGKRKGGEDKAGFQATLHFIQGFITFMMDLSQPDIPTRALECFQAAREREPDCFLWWHLSFLMSRAYRRKWDLSQLLEYSRKAYELAPAQMKIRTGLCLIWAQVEDAKIRELDCWLKGTWDLLRSVNNDLKANVDPSPLHSKWAARKLAELFAEAGRSDLMEKDSEKKNEARTSKNVRQVRKKKENKTIPIGWDELCKIVSGTKLECPPVWVVNSLDRLPQYNVNKFKSIPDYLKRQLGQREFSLAEYVKGSSEMVEEKSDEEDTDTEKLEELSAQYNCFAAIGSEEWICTKICAGSVALLLNLLKGSRWNTLGNCSTALEDNPEKYSENHLKAYRYLIKAANLCKVLLQLKTGSENPDRKKVDSLNQSILKMKEEWKALEDSAVINFVRGRLASLMGLSHDTSLMLYRKATLLEPEHALWHQMLYEKLKQMRSSGAGPNSGRPGREELGACQRASEMAPGNVKLMVDLATVKLQRLVSSLNDEKSTWLNTQLEVEAIEKLLSEVRKLAPTNSRYEMMALLKTGELYTARGLPQRTSEAKEIYNECYARWPKSSMVLHKVAKFFHTVSKPIMFEQNNCCIQALRIYEEAMQVAPANFPCLMDYLKLYGRFLRKFGEMIQVIDRSLGVIREPERVVKLMIIKGQVYWLLGQETKKNACDVWVEAFKNFPWLGSKIKEALTSQRATPEFGKLTIPPKELRPLLLKACKRQKIDISRSKALKELIAALEKPEEWGQPSRPQRQGNDIRGEISRGGSAAARTARRRAENDHTLFEHFAEAMEMHPRTRHRTL